MSDEEYIVGLLMLIGTIVLIKRLFNKIQPEYETPQARESEKDKLYKALRYLVYIVIFIIVASVTIKILIIYSILNI